MREYTVEDRADLVRAALQKPEMSADAMRGLREVLYTMSESDPSTYWVDAQSALTVWALVELARAGKVTEEMRL